MKSTKTFADSEMSGMTDSPLIYIDTNIFIYGVEGDDGVRLPSKKLLDTLKNRKGLASTSEVTNGEVLAPPTREGTLPLHMKQRVYMNLLVWSGVFDLVPISREILIETARLRQVAPLKLPDAIHLVTAIRRGCRYIVTRDGHFKNLPLGMRRVGPTFADIDALVTELP
jgi:predicted nucleic acid-binding protein